MNYEETFNSISNIKIRKKLIPELVKSLKLKHYAFSDQISNWLWSLHRFWRCRNNYKNKGWLDNDNRRLHANGHLSEVWFILKVYIFIIL